MTKLITALALVALSGCACQEHPVLCGAGAVLLAGTIKACTRHDSTRSHDIGIQPVNCANGACR